MKIVYGRELTDAEKSVATEISVECGITFDTARLLLYRNVDSVEKAKRFLSPSERGLYDPFGLKGMKEAAARIALAKERGEKVLVFGDYDADGVCASSILYRALKEYGVTAFVTVPEREEGYGLSADKAETFRTGRCVSLLVTVDCGISDRETIERIKKTGVDVIVTDHHEPPEILPDCVCVNPKIKGQEYPFDGLCGAGVAYKLAAALIGKKANAYLDLAALATVADSMDLVDENRCIVALGLKLINGAKKRAVFADLMSGSDKRITSGTLAFGFAPRVNAGGRMGDAATALKAFISDDASEVYDLCVKLNSYNIARQADCELIYREAKAMINAEKSYLNSVITVGKEGWKTGFIGIVAAKLVEDYNRPVIVFAQSGDFMKGSARSVDGINVYDAIDYAKEYALGFGGHSQAAGVSVSTDNYEKFRRAVCEFADKFPQGKDSEKELFVDMKTDGALSLAFVREIEALEPFGVGNRRPLFSVTAGSVNAKPIKAGSPHYSFLTEAIEMLDFNGAGDLTDLALDVPKEIVFEPNYSVFREKESAKGIVRYVLPDYGDFSVLSLEIFDNELKKLCGSDGAETSCGADTVRAKDTANATYTSFGAETVCATDTSRGAETEVEIRKGYGTLYLVSDEENLKKYDLKGLKIYPFEKKDKTNANCVIVSANSLPEGYDEIVYLDKPARFFPCAKSVSASGVKGTARWKTLSVDRSDFETVYKYLCSAEGKPYAGASAFYRAERPETDARQFVFAAEVFFELGFFGVKNGRLTRNLTAKSALDKSVIYNTVCGVKADYE